MALGYVLENGRWVLVQVSGPAASDLSFIPDGSISASNVQEAIQEVRDESTGSGQGPQGIQGPVGPQGVPGPMGTSFIWRGTWSALSAYVINDAVERSGETYIAIQNGTNQDPAVGQPTNAFWDILAVAGLQGPTGPTGPQGAQGVQGIQGVPGSGVNYIQDTDPTLNVPNTVVLHETWARLTDPATYAVRNTANSAWVFFAGSGGGGGSSSALLDENALAILDENALEILEN